MALTLAEAAKLSNDVLLTGVIETIIQESPVLQTLPFIEVRATASPTTRRTPPPQPLSLTLAIRGRNPPPPLPRSPPP